MIRTRSAGSPRHRRAVAGAAVCVAVGVLSAGTALAGHDPYGSSTVSATPAAGAGLARYAGTTSPGTGAVEISLRGSRVDEFSVQHKWWRCKGPRERPRQILGWGGEDGFRFPRMRRGKRFSAQMNRTGGDTYIRMRLSGRVSADGTLITGSLQRSTRGFTRYGAVQCRSGVIRFRAARANRDFAGVTSQGLPVRLELQWTRDFSSGLDPGPQPFLGIINTPFPVSGPAPDIVLTCAVGPPVKEVSIQGIRVDQVTGALSRPPGDVTVTGRAPPLGSRSRVVEMQVTMTTNGPECRGEMSLRATEVPTR